MERKRICPTCGYRGLPNKAMHGDIRIQILLFLVFLIPGMFYSLWRITTWHEVCPFCGSTHLVPLNSHAGRKLFEKFNY